MESKYTLFHFLHACDFLYTPRMPTAKFPKVCNFAFIDAQQETPHLKSLGAKTIPRKEFLEMLTKSLKHKTLQEKWTNLT